jgi:hypothetical protein
VLLLLLVLLLLQQLRQALCICYTWPSACLGEQQLLCCML